MVRPGAFAAGRSNGTNDVTSFYSLTSLHCHCVHMLVVSRNFLPVIDRDSLADRINIGSLGTDYRPVGGGDYWCPPGLINVNSEVVMFSTRICLKVVK